MLKAYVFTTLSFSPIIVFYFMWFIFFNFLQGQNLIPRKQLEKK